MTLVFDLPDPLTLPIQFSDRRFPVGRIFCVGRNYAAHAAEMGNEVDREAPFYFTKSAANAVQTGAEVPFPQGTEDFHHEVELFVALGQSVGSSDEDPLDAVSGYGCALDMTRRDLQIRERKKQRPWDLGKDLENGSVLGKITACKDWVGPGGQSIWLDVNGQRRQAGNLDDMVWSIAELLRHLSGFYYLRAGDIIMTGTPAGVGAVNPGDVITGGVTGLSDVKLTLMP
ncbi:fumarylacetoacetate hydrolase family protein [Epibacterium ulvae]|uniref:fumarylacetoacetate hydrolase family protein n=1 Tax=Epibacterium ulvae TaxID=1156985 RepID=UPI001BFCB303|nr:fumarylacetoacetate hydrolase family protein [Epibacterium ulvae]MBT8154843.1 fumarylacetoacetate hydrolase family protein [Epibacterium ulvae]